MNREIEEAIEALRICKKAIQVLHPILDPDEPCIAWEAFEAADHAIDTLSHLTSRSSRAAYDCEKSGHVYYWMDGICIYCGALKPPPA